ncbi:MAG TPA: hypothetical protein VG737_00190, partial [Cyclobacteriaceae bacterium]|nr:hypothetical protein [Cyclobacteriaceae bacterium]
YDAQVDSTKFLRVQNEISAFASKLMSKRARFKTETKFLRFAFQRVHHKYLRSYSHSEPFNGIFNDGTYNCVSGAALYSCILQQFGYKPVIYETRYHIFLMVNLADSTRVFFETTDPITGFECDDREIDSRIEKYLSAEQALLGNATALSAPFDKDVVRESISLKQLAGLHYYNLAVDLINKQNYYDAFRSLKKASILYPKSKRIKDFLGFTAIRYESELSAAFSDR